LRAKDQITSKPIDRGLEADGSSSAMVSSVTSRGTKYWKSGTIPLIGPDILGDIIAEVADISIVLATDGTILSVLSNSSYGPAVKLSNVEGEPFENILASESKVKFRARLREFDEGKAISNLEINHAREDQKWEYPVRYSFHKIGPDGTILLLGTDMRPVAEMQQQLVKAQLALEQDFEAQREYDTKLRVLMHSTTEPHVFVSLTTGEVQDINPAAASFFGQEQNALSGQKLSNLINLDVTGNTIDVLSQRALEGSFSVSGTLSHSGVATDVHPMMFRVAGERLLLCRFSVVDGDASAGGDQYAHLRALFDGTPDGIIFTDTSGQILSANEAFLDLIGLAHSSDVKGCSITDFLMRGSVDVKVMTENANRYGRMRLYATKVASDFGSPRSVEISVAALKAGRSDIYSFVLRDANRAEAARTPVPQKSEDVQSVVELVGSASLKEIVTQSTDVIERMCIETAIELTMNNRVAAAEMLGLSRQSLYVKLRKLGILSSDK